MSSNLIRWGGLAAMVGSVLWMGVFAWFASRPSGPGSAPPYRSFEGLYLPCLISSVLVVAGLMALHTHLRSTYGRFGMAGFVPALVGVAVLVVSGASWPWRNVGAFGFLLGSMLMGAAASRATVRLRWGAVAIVAGSLTFFVFDTEAARAWFALPYGGAWVVAGYLLRTNRGEAVQRPTRAR